MSNEVEAVQLEIDESAPWFVDGREPDIEVADAVAEFHSIRIAMERGLSANDNELRDVYEAVIGMWLFDNAELFDTTEQDGCSAMASALITLIFER